MIRKVHADNYDVYGVTKMHAEMNRRGHRIARCTVHRLMRAAGLHGITRAKGPRTTIPGTGPDTRPDLVDRDFTAAAPDQLWVADITYCRTFAGWVYAAFIIDVFSRRVVGWQLSKSLRTDLALDALEMGIWARSREGRDVAGLTHHSDKGVQYVAVRYTQRLAEAGAVASVGSTGDSYDNALAEAFNSLFKAELVRNRGPWKNIDDLEIAIAEYIDWFNHRRLHGEIGLVPPAELEGHPLPSQPRSGTAPKRQFRASTEPDTRQSGRSDRFGWAGRCGRLPRRRRRTPHESGCQQSGCLHDRGDPVVDRGHGDGGLVAQLELVKPRGYRPPPFEPVEHALHRGPLLVVGEVDLRGPPSG